MHHIYRKCLAHLYDCANFGCDIASALQISARHGDHLGCGRHDIQYVNRRFEPHSAGKRVDVEDATQRVSDEGD